MQAKLDQVRRLLREGYELDEIVGDGMTMEVRLRRGRKETVSVRFLPSEAEALLLTGPLGLPR